MIGVSVLLAIIVIFLCGCVWKQTYSRKAKLLNAFPLVESFVPIFGHLLKFSKKRDVLYKQLQHLRASHNETFLIWAGLYPTIHIIRPEDAEIILSNVKYIEKGLLYELFDRWLNTGLLTSTGKKWRQRRKMLTPAFHYNILHMFVDVFGEKCEELTKILTDECTKPKTDVLPIITMTTLATICETTMGIKVDQNNKNLVEYYNRIHSMAQIFIDRTLSPLLYIDIIYNISPTAWRENKLVKYLHKFTSDIIESREKTFKLEDVTDLESTDTDIKSKKRLAMLDLLLYVKQHLGEIDEEGIKEEVDTFVFAGHDTTTAAIGFILLLLANYKEVQEEVIAELDEIFSNSKRHATYDDLQNMKYLECCIKESLRLYPSVQFFVRKIQEDVPLTKHVVPAGTEVWIHISEIHRDPRYFPDPDKFDPSRFLPENSKGRHPYCYIPFSAGPRNCIGQKFAMLELKSIVSSILRNFTMEAIDTREDLNFVIDLVLRVKEPIHIKFKLRGDDY